MVKYLLKITSKTLKRAGSFGKDFETCKVIFIEYWIETGPDVYRGPNFLNNRMQLIKNKCYLNSRFFIGYWIKKRGWISILALLFLYPHYFAASIL